MAKAKKRPVPKRAKRNPKKRAARSRSVTGTKRPAKKKAAAKRKTGRPPIKFDVKQIEAFGRIGCSYAEIAWALQVSETTIDDRMANDKPFRAAYKKGATESRQGVRRAQLQSALQGNATMQIWLGKQWLDQRDVQYMTLGDVQEVMRGNRLRMTQAAEQLAAQHPEDAALIQKAARVMAAAIASDV